MELYASTGSPVTGWGHKGALGIRARERERERERVSERERERESEREREELIYSC